MSVERDLVDGLTRVLVRTCRKLAEAGHPGEAGRLAGEAWSLVRVTHPRAAQHLDGAMHHLARLEGQLEQQQQRQHLEQPEQPVATATGSATTNPTRKATAMPVDERVLDVRTEVPKRRHELIFEVFAELAPGAAYVLVNDHDPKPLRYQFEAENAGEFTWEYLEEGPEVWRVRIGRAATAPGADATA